MTVIDKPDRELMALLTWKHCLNIEIRTGLRHSSGSINKRAADFLKQKGVQLSARPRKETTLEALEKYINEHHPVPMVD